MIKLSIIVPIYNTEKYLKSCIDSLLKQDIDEYEILLVNDDSPDNSQKIIDSYVSKYPNIIKSFWKKNGGLGDARNYAIPFVKGKYIMFVDSDDYIEGNCLAAIFEKMEKDKLDILVFDFIKVYDGKKFIHEQSMKNSSIEEYILSTPNACNKIFKSSLFKDNEIKFPLKIWYEDFAIIPGLVKYTKKIGYLNKGIYYYQFRSESIMNQVKYNPKILDISKAVDNLRTYLEPEFHCEMEYLSLQHQYYGAALKLLPFKKYKELDFCISNHEKLYPTWKSNPIYKKKSFLYRFFCSLLEKKHYYLAYQLLNIRRKLSERS